MKHHVRIILALLLCLFQSVGQPVWAQSSKIDNVKVCAAQTRFFATKKAEFDASPMSRFGQITAMTLAAGAGAGAGAATGTIVGNQNQKINQSFAKKVELIEKFYSLERNLSRNYDLWFSNGEKLDERVNVIVTDDTAKKSFKEALNSLIREADGKKWTVSEFNGKLAPLLKQHGVPGLGDVADRYYDSYVMQRSHHAQLDSLERNPLFKELSMAGILPKEGGRWYRGAIVTQVTDGNYSRANEKLGSPPKVSRLRSALNGPVGGGLGAIAGGALATAATATLVKNKCDKSLSISQAQSLAVYVQVSVLTECEFSSKGAAHLATASDEEIEALCKQIPNLHQITNSMLERHYSKISKLAAPKDFKLECSGATLKEIRFTTSNGDRSYAASPTNGSVTVKVKDDKFNYGSKKSDGFEYNVAYDPDQKKYGRVVSSGVYPQAMGNLSSMRAEDLQDYRLKHELDQTDKMRRQYYLIGESLDYLAPLVSAAEKTCSESSATPGNGPVVEGTD